MSNEMKLKEIKKYIETYARVHSRDAIERQLKNSGYKKEDVSLVYSMLDGHITGEFEIDSKKKMGFGNGVAASEGGEAHSGLALGLAISGFIIPVLGIFMEIFALVLAFKARKINRDDGKALAAIILGCIFFGIAFLILLFILYFIKELFSNTEL